MTESDILTATKDWGEAEIAHLMRNKMDYNKLFIEVVKGCRDSRAHVILGLLQSIRDNRLPDSATKEEMLKLCYNPKIHCILNYTQDSIKIDSK